MTGEGDGAGLDEFLSELARIGAFRAFNDHIEPGVHDAIQHASTPLDDNNRVSKINIKIIEFNGAVETIRIHVNEGWAINQARVSASQDKSGTRDRTSNAEAFTNATGQCGLPGTERSGEHQNVSRTQCLPQLEAKFVHLVRILNFASSEH
jgi:hypothetical protein